MASRSLPLAGRGCQQAYILKGPGILIRLMRPKGSGDMITGDDPLTGFEGPSKQSIARPIIPVSRGVGFSPSTSKLLSG
jgi:hypothetical protein